MPFKLVCIGRHLKYSPTENYSFTMNKNFTQITFTDSVKNAQEKFGSREIYSRVESKLLEQTNLFQREVQLIKQIDGFYMATVNAQGWPYVQFRGGPKGFLKVINQQTIGFADFKGNMQYISTGNINETGKTSLILMHYPTRRRLKIWAETEIKSPEADPELAEQLVDQNYDAVVERLVLLNIVTYDWNCPQHIPQRYTVEEFKEDILPKHPEIIEDCCPQI